MTNTQEKEPTSALLIAFLAFVLWGFLPVYLKQMKDVSPWVVTCSRVLWTVPWAFGIGLVTSRFAAFKVPFSSIKYLALSGLFIGLNWTIYTWMVSNNMIMEASLGYFVNPLMNVALGIFIFKEKLGKLKIFAVVLAAVAVAYQSLINHHVPVLGLGLAALFSGYSLIRKQVRVEPAVGLFWESLAISPIAIAGFIFLAGHGIPLLGSKPSDSLWLLLTGPATAVPLTLFAFGARHLKMSTLGMLQYVAPSLVFIMSLFYGEKFDMHQAVTFGLIWGGLALYSWAEFAPKKAKI